MNKNKPPNLREELQTNKKFNPFNQEYDFAYISDFIQKNYEFLNEEDIQTAYATQIFHTYYNKYYLDFKTTINSLSISKERLLEYLIEYSNYEHYCAKIEIKELFANKTPTNINDALMARLPSSKLDIDGIAEACIDTLNHAVNLVHFSDFVGINKSDTNKPQINTTNKDDGRKLQSFIADLWININYYSSIKEWYDKAIWKEDGYCQWDRLNNKVLIKIKNYNYAVLRSIGLYRLQSDILGENLLFKRYIDNFPKEHDMFAPLKQYKTNMVIDSCYIEAGYIKYTLKKGEYDKKELFDLFFMGSGLSIYYEFIMREKFPQLSNLTLKNLLSLMNEFHGLISAIQQPNINHYQKYTEYIFPCRIKIDDLENYFLQRTFFSIGQIREFLKLLSHSHTDKRYNFWDKLIIKHHDYYVFPLLNITAPNILYLVDIWLDAAKYNLEKRGTLFEEYIKKKLKTFLNKKGYLYKLAERKKYKYNKEEEEIDIILTTKHSVLIGDIKCIKHPLEARDYFNSYDRLKKGAEQVKKKTEFILRHKDFFSKDIGDIENKEIIQVVITNYPLFSGIKINNILIIDFSLLSKYVDKGDYTIEEIINNEKVMKEYKKYYHNEEEFSQNLSSYLHDPTIISNIKSFFGINKYEMNFDNTKIYAEFIELQEDFLKKHMNNT